MLTQLKDISPYNALSDDELESFFSRAVVRKFRKGTIVIFQGDDTDSLYIVREGEMKVYVEDESGKELTVRILREGDTFGELALLGGFPRSANVIAMTDGSAFVISKSSYLDCLKNNPQISISLIQSLANMVRETTGELSNIALSDVYGRLVHVLEKYAFDHQQTRLVPKFTHREIASMIGSSREMVSKILKDLEKGGYLSVSGKHYQLNRQLPAKW